MPPDQQKNALGERLFTTIHGTHPDLAAKITGMLLEMDAAEILGLLQQPSLLGSKVSEALEVLQVCGTAALSGVVGGQLGPMGTVTHFSVAAMEEVTAPH